MSEFNINITDQELRDLLKMNLLEENENKHLTEKLITMETQLVFAHEPLFTPSPSLEKKLLKKLNSGTSSIPVSFNKWLLYTLGITGIITAAIFLNRNITSTSPTATNTTVEIVQNETVVEDQSPIISEFLPEKPDIHKKELIIPILETEETLDSTTEHQTKQERINTFIPPVPFNPIKRTRKPPVQRGRMHSYSAIPPQIDTIFSGIKRVEIEGGICDVELIGSQRKDVEMKGAIQIKQTRNSQKKNNYKIKHQINGNTLKIWVENKRNQRIFKFTATEVIAYINLKVPKSTDVIISNQTGEISIEQLAGKVCNLSCNLGNISARNIKSNIEVKTNSGDIKLTQIDGNVAAKSSLGNQQFEQIQGNLNTVNSSGNIDVNQLSGSLDITSSLGDIALSHCNKNIRVKTSSGDIDAQDIKGPDCTLTTSLGNISVKRATSTLKLTSSSGNVSVLEIKGNISLTTSMGNLNLESVTGNVVAKTSSGRISLKKITGNITSSTNIGKINLFSTRGSLNAQTSSGDITGSDVTLISNAELKTTNGDIQIQLSNGISELSFDLETKLGKLEISKGKVTRKGENKELKLEGGNIRIKGITHSGDQKYE